MDDAALSAEIEARYAAYDEYYPPATFDAMVRTIIYLCVYTGGCGWVGGWVDGSFPPACLPACGPWISQSVGRSSMISSVFVA